MAVLETITTLWPKKRNPTNRLGGSFVGTCVELAQRKHPAAGQPKPVSVSKKTQAGMGMAPTPDTKIIRELGTDKIKIP